MARASPSRWPDSPQRRTPATLVAGTLPILAAGALGTAMAVGLSALVGSRGPVIGDLLAFFLAIEPLVGGDRLPGRCAPAMPTVALARIGDVRAAARHRARHLRRRGRRLVRGAPRRSGSAHGRRHRARSEPGRYAQRVSRPSPGCAARPTRGRRRCVALVVGVPTLAGAVAQRRRPGRTSPASGSAWPPRCRCWSGAAGRSPCWRPSSPRRCSRTVDVPFEVPLVVALYTIGAKRSWEATIAADAARRAVAAVYALAGGPQFADRRDRSASRCCARVAAGVGLYIGGKRTSIATLRGARRSWPASASCSPSGPWPRSACGSRRSCTTSSATTSA